MTWKRTADAVVIGGGMMGMATAYYLKKLGMKDVVLLEKNTVASGATGRCAAAFRATWGGELNIILGKACIEKYEHLEEELGMDIGLYQNGYLFMAYSDAQLENFKKCIALQNSLGVPSRMLTHDDARELCPGINVDDVKGFYWYKRDGHADPMLTNFAHQEAAKREGVVIEKFTEVTGFKMAAGAVKGVCTSKGYIDTDIVINAAGAWSGKVAAMAGLSIPVHGERHEIFATEPVDFNVCPTFLMSYDPDFYMQQRPHGSIIAGCGPHRYRAEAAPFNDYEMGDSWDFLEHMTGIMNHVLPRTKGNRVVRQWSGMYDITPDMQPVIGEAQEMKGFWMNVSGSRGFMFGPVAGEMVAEQILFGKTALPIEKFHWDRYARGEYLLDTAIA